MAQYSDLSRAQLSYQYLHTNSTTHEFLFGAVAELIDNARDAGATELDIYTVNDKNLRGGYMLCFLDNGCGMDRDETMDVITFGKSVKRKSESNSIGMYGNGLKSGSMRVGNDLIVFTKKESLMTCLFLSRTFHEEEDIDEVIVPLPSFDVATRKPFSTIPEDLKRHDLETKLIYKYSPFRCEKDLLTQFDKIKGPNGSLVIIYNMKLLDSGDPELDTRSDPKDILLANPDVSDAELRMDVELPLERRSLRAYVSILYVDPRMKVYIQGKKVQTKRLISCLYKPRMYNYASRTFKSRAEQEANKAKEDAKLAEMKAREAESKAKDLEKKYGDVLDQEQRVVLRKARDHVADLRKEVLLRKQIAQRKQKALKDPKTLTFNFGLNLENRASDGMFIYNCSRLIRMYQRIGPQQDSGMTCRGVVGVVNVPYLVLEPTHNKQDFADAKEFRALMRAMADHLMQYWDDLEVDKYGVDQFWASFGYLSAKWRDQPSDEPKFIRKRALSTQLCVQCDQCLKWRILPFQANQIGKEVPDNWQCVMNPDPKHKRCSEPEQQQNIPMGVLRRKIKTKEQRQLELEDQIRKKQEELEKMKKVYVPHSEMETEDTTNRGKGRASSQSAINQMQQKSKRRSQQPSESEEEEEEDEEEEEESSEEEEEEEETEKSGRKSTPANRANRGRASQSKVSRANAQMAVRGRQIAKRGRPSRTPAKVIVAKPIRTRLVKQSSSEEEDEEEEEEAESSEEEEEEEEEEDQTKSKRAKPTPSPSKANSNAVSRKRASSPVDAPVKKKSRDSETLETESTKKSPMKEPEPEKNNSSAANASSSRHPMTGKAVDVRVGRQWIRGRIEEFKMGRCRVKFSNMPDDSHDRWLPLGSSEMRVLQQRNVEESDSSKSDENAKSVPDKPPAKENHNRTTSNEPSTKSTTASAPVATELPQRQTSPQKQQKETPTVNENHTKKTNSEQSQKEQGNSSKPDDSSTSSVPAATASQSNPAVDKIVENFRVCLRYFVPPDWPMDKDRITSLSLQELADFPLDHFFDRYEHGLKKLVANFQLESINTKRQLVDLRKGVAQMLISARKEEKQGIDFNFETDNVDKEFEKYLKDMN